MNGIVSFELKYRVDLYCYHLTILLITFLSVLNFKQSTFLITFLTTMKKVLRSITCRLLLSSCYCSDMYVNFAVRSFHFCFYLYDIQLFYTISSTIFMTSSSGKHGKYGTSFSNSSDILSAFKNLKWQAKAPKWSFESSQAFRRGA